MTEQTQLSPPELDVLEFEVHAVYGAHFGIEANADSQNRWSDWFEDHRRSSLPIREGWTPIYRDHCSAITVDIATPAWCEAIEVQHPAIFRRGEAPDAPTPSPVKMRVSRRLTVRKDGVAAVTIRLKAERRLTPDGLDAPYTLADILSPLLLAPRIMHGIELHPHEGEVKASDEMATTKSEVYRSTRDAKKSRSVAILDGLATTDKSPLYKLFLGALKDVVSVDPEPDWFEFRAADAVGTAREDKQDDGRRSSEILPWVGDQQVPYFVVLATLPGRVYNTAFLEGGAELQKEKLAARRPYTRTLAAILQRWLSPRNATYVSVDFLESLGLLKEGVFVNKYMNSLSFVTYCSTGTLCLRPELKNGYGHGALDPQEATYGSILRCVEFSRLRWHHALRLNRLLDDLTERVIRHTGTERFDDFVAELLSIRAESALHFLDPLTYQWDAAVGADIAKFLQGDVIDRVEDECIEKLNMVKQLIHESLDVVRVRQLRQSMLRS